MRSRFKNLIGGLGIILVGGGAAALPRTAPAEESAPSVLRREDGCRPWGATAAPQRKAASVVLEWRAPTIQIRARRPATPALSRRGEGRRAGKALSWSAPPIRIHARRPARPVLSWRAPTIQVRAGATAWDRTLDRVFGELLETAVRVSAAATRRIEAALNRFLDAR